jgi:SAM-dependent methyltransferase
MEINRNPFQGVWNIIRFNWHFYAGSAISLVALWNIARFLDATFQTYVYILIGLITATSLISLGVSFFVYDLSPLYKLPWLDNHFTPEVSTIVNINAGFDETSELLANRFSQAELVVLDFYNPDKHTEISIRRARRAYPPYPDTKTVATGHLPLADSSIDKTFAFLAAHEIREDMERVAFFEELYRITRPGGQVLVTEHLRDIYNFLAYNLGYFHFHSYATWTKTFSQVGFAVSHEIKTTPFITTFILTKHGNSL